MINGIILIIIPLLALTADQMPNTMNAVQEHGSIEAHHLDDISPSAVCNNIIPRMDEIEYITSSTIFLFSSPYYIMKNLAILDAILRWHAKKTLCLVAMDKAHL